MAGIHVCSGFCPSKRECAKPDPKECDIGNDILDRDPFLKIEWDVNAPNIVYIRSS